MLMWQNVTTSKTCKKKKNKCRKTNIRTKLLTEYNFIVVKYPIWQASGNIKIDGANIISFN